MAKFQMSLWNRDGFLFRRAKDDLLTQPQDLSSNDLDGDILKSGASQRWPLGTRIHDVVGDRYFVYTKNGAAALAPGVLVQSPVPEATHEDLAVQTAAVVGDTTLKVTNSAVAIVANDYAGGFLLVNQGAAGFGDIHRIKSHDADAGSGTVTFTLHDPIRRALATATHKVTLLAPLQKNVIIHPSPPTALVVGVPLVAIAANEFFFAQTWGLGPGLVDTTVVIGNVVVPSVNVDGAVGPIVLTEGTPNVGAGQLPVGWVPKIGDNTDYAVVYWRISN